MDEKEKQIIKEGMKLFATKGYHKTSIQDIATNANISKGGFYLHFRSKAEFVTHAIRYFHNEMVTEVAKIGKEELTPRQSLAKQITKITTYVYTYRDFITMHIRGDISIGNHTEKLFEQLNLQNMTWLQESLIAIYSDQIKKHIMDLSVQLEGLMNSYFKWIILDDIHINVERFGVFIVERMDDIVDGLLTRHSEPILNITNTPKRYHNLLANDYAERQMSDLLSRTIDQIVLLSITPSERAHLFNVIKLIKQKMTHDDYEPITIQGLLAHFNDTPELHQACEDIAELLQIKRLK